MTENTATQAAASKLPTHIAYHVKKTKSGGYWTRIGAAWEHNDGKGFSLQLELTPADRNIMLRVASRKPA